MSIVTKGEIDRVCVALNERASEAGYPKAELYRDAFDVIVALQSKLQRILDINSSTDNLHIKLNDILKVASDY